MYAKSRFGRLLVVAIAGSTMLACTGIVIGNDEVRRSPESRPGDVTANTTGEFAGYTGAFLRRLTNAEYNRTVADVFGETTDIASTFPSNPYLDGYDNNVLALNVSGPVVQAYASAAQTIASNVLASTDRRGRVVGCEMSAGTRLACLNSILDRTGRRAFRRPVSPEERADLLTLADAAANDPDPFASASLLLQGLMMSPSFLYRVEIGAPAADRPGITALTGYEVATRLSYLFLGTTPEDALLDEAAKGTLDNEAGVEATAGAMLRDSRARPAVENFTKQWLGLYKLDRVTRAEDTYPKWNTGLKEAMVEETRRYVEDFVWKDGAAFLDVLTSKHSYVNGALAELYQVPAPAGDAWGQVDFTAAQSRGGLLTQASILTAAGNSEAEAVILRGKFVRDMLTCDPPSPPPPGVPALNEPKPGETVRERLEQHRSDPKCAGCHQLMDPIGFGLEQYDLVGAHRTTDASGKALSGEGSLVGFENPNFTGPVELAQRLRDSAKVSRCVVKHLLQYSAGRSMTASDDGLIDAMDQSFRSANLELRHLMTDLVKSDRYRYFKTGEGQ